MNLTFKPSKRSIALMCGVLLSIPTHSMALAPLTSPRFQSHEYQSLQSSTQQAEDLINAAWIAANQEQWETAQTYLQDALALEATQANILLELRVLNLLTLIETVLGDYDALLPHAQQFVTVAQAEQNIPLLTQAYQALGTAYFYTGEFSQALDAHQQALSLATQLQDPYRLAVAYAQIGETYLALEALEAALSASTTALELAEPLGDPTLTGLIYGNLGKAYTMQSDYARAQSYLEAALTAEQAAGTPLGIAQALNNLGNVLLLAGDLPESERYLRDAIALWEQQRQRITEPQRLIQFFDTQLVTYRLLQQVLIAQDQTEAALIASEQSRAQILSAQLAATEQLPLDNSDNTIDLVTLQSIAQQQNITLVEYALIPRNAELFSPGRSSDRWLNTIEHLFVWVIQPSGEIHFEQVDLFEQPIDLTNLVATMRQTLGVRSGNAATIEVVPTPEAQAEQQERQQAILQDLYHLLIAPIATYLPSDPQETVVIIPQESLFLVPFPALINPDGQYLIEQHTLATAPSIQVLSQLQQNRPTGRGSLQDNELLIVGNPTMPSILNLQTNQLEPLSSLMGAEAEAIAIATRFETEPLLGETASEQRVVQQMPTARVIHLATHGLLDYRDGETDLFFPGAIALAPGNGEDGLLTAAEIYDLSLSAELVVLSACDTGRGSITGDGVVGLSRAFIQAGVPQIMVSLWAVPDAPTAELMTIFYEQRELTDSDTQALRQSMLIMLEAYPNPRDWAAFILIGGA